MKLGKRKSLNAIDNALGMSGPSKNYSKKNMKVTVIIVITALLIVWVYSLGMKANKTVKVVMLNQNVYKNQVITEDMLKPYDMIKAEFEKYAVTDQNGQKVRRIVLWDERNKVLNTFAAYPLQKDTVLEYRTLIKSRIDNSDTVLYSFPGKEIVPLEVGSNELQAFKAYLQPGDRLNIEAIFSEKAIVAEDDGLGGVARSQMDIFKTETVFKNIVIADLLNQSGESILDIYAMYRDLPTSEQAKLDASQQFKERTKPATLLVALTPEEKERYYYYLSKSQVKFRVSMPQRSE